MAYVRKEDAVAVRNELKKAFPDMRFSVRVRHHSELDVSLMKGPSKFLSLFDDASDYEKNYMHRSLNHFHPHHYGKHESFVKKVSEIVHNAPGRADSDRMYFDDSDAQIDYFYTAFYVTLAIGKWDKPFEVMKKKK